MNLMQEKPAAKATAAPPPQAKAAPSSTKRRARKHRPPPTSPSPDRSPSRPGGTPVAPPPRPEPTPPPPGPEPPAPVPQPPVPQAAAQQAAIVWKAIIPALMTRALGVEGHVQAPGCRVLLDRLVANAGGPEDAVEVMLIEQLTMAHFRAAQLQAQAAEAKSAEAVQIYNTAASRLLAEFRKTALALQTYREKAMALARAECQTSPGGTASSRASTGEPAPGGQRGGSHGQKT